MKISDGTHTRLQKVGTLGETFDDAIKRLLDDFEDVILQVKIVGNKRQIHLKNPKTMTYFSRRCLKFTRRSNQHELNPLDNVNSNGPGYL
jgi:hypothetical protein